MGLLFQGRDEVKAAASAVIGHLNRIEDGISSVARAAPKLGDAGRHVDRLGDALKATQRHVASLDDGMRAVVGFVVFRAAVEGVRNSLGTVTDSIKLASDTSESMNKVDVVFGSAADSIKRFASTASTDLGLSQRAALEATGTFGNLFVAMGIGDAQTADMSKNLLNLAADLASFNNISTDEALIKLRAGLVGEAEPLRTLGVNLTEATIQAKALELGLMHTGDTLTASGKAQAAYALIFEQTAVAQGDFARTSQGLANQLRTLDANFTDLKASAGEALLPLATEGVQALNSFMNETKRLIGDGLTPLEAALKTGAASLRTNFGDDAAQAFEGITGAVGRAAEGVTSGKQTIFQALGGMGEEIGTLVKTEWGPAFLEWAVPVKDHIGFELGKVWDEQLKPWIEQTGKDIGTEAKDKWIPAFNDWAKDNRDALRPGLEALGEDALDWARTDGAKLMAEVAKELALAVSRNFTVVGITAGLAQDLGNEIGGRLGPGAARAAGAQPKLGEQLVDAGGGEMLFQREIDARARAQRDRDRADASQVSADARAAQRAADSEASAAAAAARAAGRTGGAPTSTPPPPPKPKTPTKPPEHVESAIEGFMRELARDAPRWEKAFGDVGAKVMLALGDAIESGSGGAGAQVAKALQDLKDQAERSGVADWANLGDELAGSLHNALIDRGNPALRAAAMENLRAYTEAIKAANALTADTFAKAFDVEAAKTALGSGGRSVMAALETAIKEGGVKNIEALAGSVAGMREALFNDRDLSPAQAQEQWGRIFEAVNTAISDGSADAQAALAQFFRDLNFEQQTMKVADSLAAKIKDAAEDFDKAVTTAGENAAKQIQAAMNSLADSRALRGARENVDKSQAEDLKNVINMVDAARQAWHDYRESQHTDDQRAREDADLARSRAQEDAAIANRARTGGVTAGLGGGMSEEIRKLYESRGQSIGRDPATDPSRLANVAARDLATRRNLEDAERARKRGEQDQDRAKALTERAADAEKEKGFAGIIDEFRRTQATQLRGFLDEQEDIALEVQKGRIRGEEAEAIAAAGRVKDAVELKALEEYTTAMGRIALQRQGWDQVLDGYLADIETAKIKLDELGGGKGGVVPPPDFGPLSVPGAVPGVPVKDGSTKGGITIAPQINIMGPVFGVDDLADLTDAVVGRLSRQIDTETLTTGGVAG